MNILYEDTIPRGQDYFSTLGNAQAYAWQSLRPEDLVDIDILAVRSTTIVNRELLTKANRLKFVTTATAGSNHLDTDTLKQQGIAWNTAAGCNARAVAEYVLSALLNAHQDGHINLTSTTVGIVGAGFVGSALAGILDSLNIHYKLCDPLLKAKQDTRPLESFAALLDCDVLTLHVPFTHSGAYPTAGMINADVLADLRSNQLLINACRGEVIHERALYRRLQQPDAPKVVLDVFENEPDINTAILSSLYLATPHIAGHTMEGKLGGTQMVYEQICQHIGEAVRLRMTDFLTPVPAMEFSPSSRTKDRLDWADLSELIFSIYDIKDDDRHFRQSMAESDQFATLRKNYRVRRELSAHSVTMPASTSDGVYKQISSLGFSVIRK